MHYNCSIGASLVALQISRRYFNSALTLCNIHSVIDCTDSVQCYLESNRFWKIGGQCILYVMNPFKKNKSPGTVAPGFHFHSVLRGLWTDCPVWHTNTQLSKSASPSERFGGFFLHFIKNFR